MRLFYVPQYISESIEQARGRVQRSDLAQWRDLVARFSARARDLDPQAEIWAATDSEFLITAVTPRDDLDHELAFHAIFIDLARDVASSATGALIVRTTAEARDELDFGERVA